jgi:hypothetical protein
MILRQIVMRTPSKAHSVGLRFTFRPSDESYLIGTVQFFFNEILTSRAASIFLELQELAGAISRLSDRFQSANISAKMLW